MQLRIEEHPAHIVSKLSSFVSFDFIFIETVSTITVHPNTFLRDDGNKKVMIKTTN
jgi:hypothetical protein